MQLLTVAQVAEQVGLSEWAVRRAIHDGELAAYAICGRLLVGRGSDTADPLCAMAPGHVGPCKTEEKLHGR